MVVEKVRCFGTTRALAMPVFAHRSVVCDERDSIGTDCDTDRIKTQLMKAVTASSRNNPW